MNNAPEAIRTAVTSQVVLPLAEVVTGNRPVAQVRHLLTAAAEHQLSAVTRTPTSVSVVAVRAQVLPGVSALEVAAVLQTGTDQRVHALAVRVALLGGRPMVVSVEAPSLR